MDVYRYAGLFLIIASAAALGAHADRLPNATYENQRISISTVIDVVGMVDSKTMLSWDLSSDYLHNGILHDSEAVSSLLYTDSLMTNGGHLMMNGNFDFDSGNQVTGLNNLERTKVITYESINGSHLVADEVLSIQTAGNYSSSDNYIRCVFASSSTPMVPAFCNTVTAKSSLVNVNSAQISTSAAARTVTDTGAPAGLSYRIDVTPDTASGHDFAIGSVSTAFSGHILEGRDSDADGWNKTASDNTFKDKTEVSGSIKQFSKNFEYGSGFYL